jgi:hypothetical protein
VTPVKTDVSEALKQTIHGEVILVQL